MKRWTLLVVTVVVALLVGACADRTETGAESTTTAPPTTEAATTSTTQAPTTEAATDTAEDAAESSQDDPASCETRVPGVADISFESGGNSYPVRTFLPAAYDGSPLPLVINWHGLGSDGQQQAVFSNYEVLADTEGFVVIHPTGIPDVAAGRNSWELDQFDEPGRDDLAMTGELIDHMIAAYCVDPDRVYSTGMSNGGFYTSRLVCELSDRIAAAVSVSGLSHYPDCSPTRAVPFMALHGTADAVVPFSGGGSTLLTADSPAGQVEFFNQVMPDEFAEFAADFSCQAEPEVVVESTEVTKYTYQGCQDDVPLVFYEVANGGHTWPGTPLGPFMADSLGFTTDDVGATADGWAFMSQHSLGS